MALEAFQDPVNRRRWRDEKHMTVFPLQSPDHLATEIDLFVEAPVDFEAVYARRVPMEVAPGVSATFVALDDLLVLKRCTGSDVDDLDVRRLEAIRRAQRDDRGGGSGLGT